MKQYRTFPILPLLFSVGLILCAYLVLLTFRPNAGHLCAIFGSDCSAAVASDYAKIASFSSASLGFSYFTFQLLLIALGPRLLRKEPFDRLVFLQSIPALGALLFSIYFAWLLLFILPESCAACMGVHLINLLVILTLAFRLFRLRPRLPISQEQLRNMLIPFTGSALTAFTVLLAINLAETRYLLRLEQAKASRNLEYARFLYKQEKTVDFSISPDDEVFGDKALAVHCIVLIYKDGCPHCRAAREKLIPIAMEHPETIYLITKNYDTLQDKSIGDQPIRNVPLIYVDGKRAEGWELPEFFRPFIEDCGC